MRLRTAGAIGAVVAIALLAVALSGLWRDDESWDPVGVLLATAGLGFFGYISWHPDLRDRRLGEGPGQRSVRIISIIAVALLLGALVLGMWQASTTDYSSLAPTGGFFDAARPVPW